MERLLVYVSRKLLTPENHDLAIADIVAVARSRNASLGITGALISTTDFFAQYLEGSAEAIDELMVSIDRDARHTDVTVLQISPIARRRLPSWSMGYSGPSTYVANRIAPLLGANLQADPVRIDRLMSLLVEFASA